MLHDQILTFVLQRNWEEVDRDNKFISLQPPARFKAPESFLLRLPLITDAPDYIQYNQGVIRILSKLYKDSYDDLDRILIQKSRIFSVRVSDESVESGTIPFIVFEELMDRLRSILLSTADFVLQGLPESLKTLPESEKYLAICRFLQTERGSFVAKIQLPEDEQIRPRDIVNREDVYSSHINDRFHRVLEFVNDEVFEQPAVDLTEEYFDDHRDKINLNIVQGVRELYEQTQLQNIDFNFSGIERKNTIPSREIRGEKFERLVNFESQVKDWLHSRVDMDLTGWVISLTSKDPDSDRNTVIVDGIWNGMRVKVSAHLNTDDYKDAVDLHKRKVRIRLVGTARKLKTLYSMRIVETFEIA